jgi:hypothetical protein
VIAPRALGALAFTASLAVAQGTPPDSVRRDSSGVRTVVARDSVKQPFAIAYAPLPMGASERVRWTRDELFQMGALNAAELVERLTGVRMLRTGFVLAPQAVTWWGETGRVRVFVDGVEIDILNPREGTVQDLGAIATWNIEEVVAERSSSELRLHFRTWRVAKTTSESRVDVLTGDEETNLYRAFFGRRFQSGLGLQFAFEQVNTIARRGGGGDALGLFGRLGWTGGPWSIDASLMRSPRTRSQTVSADGSAPVPAFTGGTSSSTLRIGLGSADVSSAWAQVSASAFSFDESSPRNTSGAVVDTVDTTAFRAQYVVSGGVNRSGLRASVAARYRRYNGDGNLTPSARAEWQRGWLQAAAFVERNTLDSVLRADAAGRVSLSNWFALTGSASRYWRLGESDARRSTATAEASLRLGAYWLSGGASVRHETFVDAPTVFERGLVGATLPEAIATTFAISGPVYRAIRADVRGVLWEAPDYYRPQREIRARLGLDTEWRSRFPRGEFTIRAFGLFEHSGEMLAPVSSGDVTLISANTISTILEIRVKTATVSWQFRNVMATQYETVPGHRMPALLNLYGVRWNFSN